MNLEPEAQIEIKKISPSIEPDYPTPEWDDHPMGLVTERTSLPVEYTLEGRVMTVPELGKSFSVFRTKRNGVVSNGIFTTSPVTKITENSIHTRNSIYQFKKL